MKYWMRKILGIGVASLIVAVLPVENSNAGTVEKLVGAHYERSSAWCWYSGSLRYGYTIAEAKRNPNYVSGNIMYYYARTTPHTANYNTTYAYKDSGWILSDAVVYSNTYNVSSSGLWGRADGWWYDGNTGQQAWITLVEASC